MANPTGFMSSVMIVLALVALAVVVFVAWRYLRGRAGVTPEPELPLPTAEASFLDSSHIGGPIAGTEQFERFNPDTSKR